MKVNWKKVVIGAALLVAFAFGRFILYRRSERYVLDNSDQFILYSLLPRSQEGRDGGRIIGRFQRNGVLGQTQVTDPQLKARLVNALFAGISSDGNAADCFNPRHGIRATYNGRTVDVEICFECGAVYFTENGKSNRQFVSQEPQKVFDQALIEAKLPRAEPSIRR